MKKALFGEFIAVMISAMLWQKAYNCPRYNYPYGYRAQMNTPEEI